MNPQGRSILFGKVKKRPKEPFKLVTSSEYNEMIDKVDKLQKDIALAVRNNDMYKASRLATILSRSKAAQVVAIRRVLFNKGSSNKGMGKKVLDTNADYKQLLEELRQVILRPNKYKATPLKRAPYGVPKPNQPGKERPILIRVATYLDRAVQALYYLCLVPFGEEVAHPDSYGFRPGRSPLWASHRYSRLLNNPFYLFLHIIELDVEGCFDNIKHSWILENIPLIPKPILKSWLECGFIFLKTTRREKNGTIQFFLHPQGREFHKVVSSVHLLATFALMELILIGNSNLTMERIFLG